MAEEARESRGFICRIGERLIRSFREYQELWGDYFLQSMHSVAGTEEMRDGWYTGCRRNIPPID